MGLRIGRMGSLGYHDSKVEALNRTLLSEADPQDS